MNAEWQKGVGRRGGNSFHSNAIKCCDTMTVPWWWLCAGALAFLPCPETWSQSLLAHFPISWLIPHYLVFKIFFPPKSPLFSPLHLPGMSLVPRYKSLHMLDLICSSIVLGYTKISFLSHRGKAGRVSSALWQLNGRIWERRRRELQKKASLLPVSWTLP